METETKECKKLLSRKELPEKENQNEEWEIKREKLHWLADQSKKSDGFEVIRQKTLAVKLLV